MKVFSWVNGEPECLRINQNHPVLFFSDTNIISYFCEMYKPPQPDLT